MSNRDSTTDTGPGEVLTVLISQARDLTPSDSNLPISLPETSPIPRSTTNFL